jgi:Ca2+-transporting ATPase
MTTMQLAEHETGLAAAVAERRLARDGVNALVPERRGSRLRQGLRPFADPLVALLLVAIPVYLAIGDATEAIVVAVALIPIVAVGALLEARAERTLDELRRLSARTTVVRRDGRDARISALDVVVGDLVFVHEGDVVPADSSLVALTELHVDEASLTGESLPVTKHEGDDLFAGTTVLSGRAAARVVATGARTRYGAIGHLVAETAPQRTPLQQAVRRLVLVFAVIGAGACVAVVTLELARGAPWGDAVIAGIALAIATVPEEFPMVYTLYLALGARRLARDHALVRRLPSVETLGSTSVICVDKTGTLTQGRVAVAEAVGADPRALLEAAVLASEPRPFDPLDVAVLEYAAAHDVDVDALHRGDLVADYPFDPVGKYVTHVWRMAGGQFRVVAKGSVETLGEGSGTELHDTLAARGMRVIAVAEAMLVDGPSGDRRVDEAGLRFAGLIAFADPVREGVELALAECRTAGVRVVVITGDHPATAHAVVEGLQLPHEDDSGVDRVVTGDVLDAASDDELDAMVATTNVFARTRPEHKHRLVGALRRRGEVVAMTGDGVNDAPALRAADIGVAMGERGTDVAREAATLVLLDDNFTTIVRAVRDGRRIFDNLRHAFAYLVAFHPPLVLAALVVPVLDRPLLLLPVHLLLLQLLLQPIVSLVFEADPPDADLMTRQPRDPRRSLVGRDLLRPFASGLALAVAVIVSYLVALHDWPVREARAFAFVVMLMGQWLLVFQARGRRASTPVMRWLLAGFALVIVAIVGFSPLAHLLELRAFPLVAWPVAFAIAAVTSGAWLIFVPLLAMGARSNVKSPPASRS